MVKLLSGIVVPTITPLTRDGLLDESAVRRHLRPLVRSGVSALFVAGTTGEGPALPLAVRRRLVEMSCEEATPHIPVVVAALETSAREILATASHAARAGARAIAVAPPFYLSLSQDDIAHLVEIVNGESELPAYLYNVPYAHLPQFGTETLRRVAALDRILGLKDSSGDFERLCAAIEVFRPRPECSVLVGPERLLARAMHAGADGGVSGGANLFPALYAKLYAAAQAGLEIELARLQQRVLEVEEQFYGVGSAASALVRGLKTALSVEGFCLPELVAPYRSASEPETALVRQRLAGWQDVVLQADRAVE